MRWITLILAWSFIATILLLGPAGLNTDVNGSFCAYLNWQQHVLSSYVSDRWYFWLLVLDIIGISDRTYYVRPFDGIVFRFVVNTLIHLRLDYMLVSQGLGFPHLNLAN